MLHHAANRRVNDPRSKPNFDVDETFGDLFWDTLRYDLEKAAAR